MAEELSAPKKVTRFRFSFNHDDMRVNIRPVPGTLWGENFTPDDWIGTYLEGGSEHIHHTGANEQEAYEKALIELNRYLDSQKKLMHATHVARRKVLHYLRTGQRLS